MCHVIILLQIIANYETIKLQTTSAPTTPCADSPLTTNLPVAAYSTTCSSDIPESPENAKLDGPQPWCCDSVSNSATASLKIDLGKLMTVHGIATQVTMTYILPQIFCN